MHTGWYDTKWYNWRDHKWVQVRLWFESELWFASPNSPWWAALPGFERSWRGLLK